MGVLGLNEDASTVEQLITYGVPGVIALLGVWLGRVWERRSGTQSWRRDRRLDAYAGFLTVLNDLREHSIRLGDLQDAEEFGSERARTRDVARRLPVITGQIALLGPSGVEDVPRRRAARSAMFSMSSTAGNCLLDTTTVTRRPRRPG
jgi:hypothetical protein